MRRFLISTLLVLVLVSWIGLSPVEAQGGAYIVRRGDSLTSIAARYGVSVSSLAAVNGLSRTAWVYVGQRLTIPGQTAPPAAPSPSGSVYIVRRGDTLTGIAARHGVTVSQLAAANGVRVNAWVYIGQRLNIPGGTAPAPGPTPTPVPPANPPATTGGVYIVRRGDTLIGIARRFGVSTSQLAAKNGLVWNSWVYVGQRLVIPGQSGQDPNPPANPQPPANPNPPAGGSGEKWIDVNLSTQTLTAYEGQTAVLVSRVSTGTRWTPTVVGTYRVLSKYTAIGMSGPGYSLPNVPHTMFFYRGYAIHGTYWHNNFGTPMSHGCVNMNLADAKWLFNWAPMGTKVVTHY